MDGKAERADAAEAHESYTMLMETDAILRDHRTLRRELCISRMVIFILLIISVVSCAILYIQQNSSSARPEQANETHARLHADDQIPNKADAHAPPTAFLKLTADWSPAVKPLTWEFYPDRNHGFSLNEIRSSLIIPHSGWYRLGLQITYTGRKPITISHQIRKRSKTYNWEPITVLSVYETVSETSKWYKAKFSEVVNIFSSGDEVTVETNYTEFIDYIGAPWTKTFLTAQFISVINDL